MNVHLRPLAVKDGGRVLSWRNSPAVAQHMYGDHLITAQEHQAWLTRVLGSEDHLVWIIERDATPVGLAALNRTSVQSSRYDWAFYLADPEVRGLGIGACVEYLVLRHVFDTLNGHKLWCEVLTTNEAVWRLHLSFGFKREADLRDHVLKAGAYQDVVGLGLLVDDWRVRKPSLERRLQSRGLLETAVLSAPSRRF